MGLVGRFEIRTGLLLRSANCGGQGGEALNIRNLVGLDFFRRGIRFYGWHEFW